MVRLAENLRPYWYPLKRAYTAGTRAVAPVNVQLSRARGGWLPRGTVASLEQAAATSGGRSWVARPEEVIERQVPEGRPPRHRAFTGSLREVVPPVVVAELPGGRVLGQHGAVISGAGDLVQDVSRYFGTRRPREHPIFLRPFPGAPLEVEGRLGVLASPGVAVNYYHFLLDALTRIGVLEQAPDVAPPDRWYVPAATAYHRELLDLVGIGPDQRIDSTEAPHVRAEVLVVPGLPGAAEVVNPAWTVQYLRRRLLPPGLQRVPGRRLYVYREGGRNNRTIVNQDAVLAALEPRGFERIDPGAMSVDAQIRAFAEADTIVSAHGAALANLVFASPGATVVELFPLGHMVPDYWKMAGGVPGLEYRYLAGVGATDECDRVAMLVTDVEVDVPALCAVVDEKG